MYQYLPSRGESTAVDSLGPQDLIDITEEVTAQQVSNNSHGRYRHRQAVRNAYISFSHRETSLYKFGDMDLKPGTCVELREPFGNWKVNSVHHSFGNNFLCR